MFDAVTVERRFLARWVADPAFFIRARWIWLRALGAIFFSAFYALWFQIHGLIGPTGISAGARLSAVREASRRHEGVLADSVAALDRCEPRWNQRLLGLHK